MVLYGQPLFASCNNGTFQVKRAILSFKATHTSKAFSLEYEPTGTNVYFPPFSGTIFLVNE